MISTNKKKQSKRRLLSQLDDFERDRIIGNAVSERQEDIMVNEGTNVRDSTVGASSNISVVNGNAINVKTLERCFNESIDREMNNIVDTVEDRIQNAILTAIDNIVAPKIELAIRSINASSGRDATSVSANSERREHVEIITSFENASRNNNTLGVSNANDETRHNIPDEVSELSVPEIHFDRQAHTHHSYGSFKGKPASKLCANLFLSTRKMKFFEDWRKVDKQTQDYVEMTEFIKDLRHLPTFSLSAWLWFNYANDRNTIGYDQMISTLTSAKE